jgi:endonuclease YncB( thermonuclease family)
LGKKNYHEPIRILGVDTAEIQGQCDYEIEKAIIAKKYLNDVLSHANTIVLVNPGRDKYDRVLAIVLVDGKDLSQLIIDSGNGRKWKGRRESWCD